MIRHPHLVSLTLACTMLAVLCTPFVQAKEPTALISDSEIRQFVAAAKMEVAREKQFSTGTSNTVYNYVSYSKNDVPLIYEESSNTKKPTLLVLDKPKPAPAFKPLHIGFIEDGVGGRVKIKGDDSKSMSALVTTALPNQVVLPSPKTVCPDRNSKPGGECMAWIYGGFQGKISKNISVSTDMGVVLSDKLGPLGNMYGYKPFMTVRRDSDLNPEFDDVQYVNGYLPGTKIQQFYYRNVDGKFRLKIIGTALCTDKDCTTMKPTKLVSIRDSKRKYNLKNVEFWKIVTAVTSLNNQGISQADFESIRLDGVPVPRQSFQVGETDQASIKRDANLKYSIRVNHKLY